MLLGDAQPTCHSSQPLTTGGTAVSPSKRNTVSKWNSGAISPGKMEKMNTCLDTTLERMSLEEEEALWIPALDGLDSMANDLFCSPSPILICRNKHFPYIASYHGPWLSLPIDIFHSVYAVNESKLESHQVAPIDPIIMRNLLEIRTLVDEASDLVVKAAGGGQPMTLHPNGLFTTLGKVSHVRQHRFRELAVSKLAKAYAIDEIATSVLIMQSSSALDDVAQKVRLAMMIDDEVLKKNPHHVDALYVHIFHEKIPSRMLAAYTTTDVLDQMIRSNPPACHYYRTRGMIHGFRGDYIAALKDFKMALQLVKKRKKTVQRTESSSACAEETGVDEAQLLFLRGACLHQYAVSLIEKVVRKVAYSQQVVVSGGKKKKKKNKKKKEESTLTESACTEIPPKTPSDTTYMENYQREFNNIAHQVMDLAQRSIRDFSQFLSYFPSSMTPFQHYCGRFTRMLPPSSDTSDQLEQQLEHPDSSKSFIDILSSLPMPKPPSLSADLPPLGYYQKAMSPDERASSSYHPLLVEAWYAIALNYLLVNDWKTSLLWHNRLCEFESKVQCYPVFLYARSMSQADYLETVRYLVKISSSVKKEQSDSHQPANTCDEAEDRRSVLHTKRANIMMLWLTRMK